MELQYCDTIWKTNTTTNVIPIIFLDYWWKNILDFNKISENVFNKTAASTYTLLMRGNTPKLVLGWH